MSDPIKAALEVAAMLPCREANDRCLCHEAGALDMDTCGNELPDIAAAIAAFLDAIDPAGLTPYARMAAAVRRAAGGE